MTCAFAAASFYATISIFRHDRFASDAYDLGIFDQTIWGYSRFEIVPNTVKGVPNLLGDHFHPALMALAPAYWVWNDARVLLVVQALLLATASLPIFWWARPRLGLAGANAVQVAFLAFWGLLAGVIFDFHELALAVPAISFGLYALLERRPWLFWSMFALGCLCKEDIALTFTAMGVYALVVQRRPDVDARAACAGSASLARGDAALRPRGQAGHARVHLRRLAVPPGRLAAASGRTTDAGGALLVGEP